LFRTGLSLNATFFTQRYTVVTTFFAFFCFINLHFRNKLSVKVELYHLNELREGFYVSRLRGKGRPF